MNRALEIIDRGASLTSSNCIWQPLLARPPQETGQFAHGFTQWRECRVPETARSLILRPTVFWLKLLLGGRK